MYVEIKCKNCGASKFKKIDDKTFECKYCGIQVRRKVFKPHIEPQKAIILDDSKEEIEEVEKEHEKKNSFALVKLLLCIFLGYYGVHRFVEGKVLSGIIYFLTYGLFGIGYICDIVRLAKELAHESYKENE